MTALSHIRSFSVVLATIAATSSLGCARAGALPGGAQFGRLTDGAQEAVEHALRHHPDPEATREAMVAFSKACDAGEAASCSAVGVMYELGLDFPADTRRAHELYRAACAANNARACENLWALNATDQNTFHERVATLP